MIKGELDESLPSADCEPSCDLGDLSLPEFLFEEALQLVDLDDDIAEVDQAFEVDADRIYSAVLSGSGESEGYRESIVRPRG